MYVGAGCTVASAFQNQIIWSSLCHNIHTYHILDSQLCSCPPSPTAPDMTYSYVLFAGGASSVDRAASMRTRTLLQGAHLSQRLPHKDSMSALLWCPMQPAGLLK